MFGLGKKKPEAEENNPKHDLKEGQILESDNKEIAIAHFKAKNGRDRYCVIYKKEGKWVLVSDVNYEGGGLICFIKNYSTVGGPDLKTKIKITKLLPNVVFGEMT